MIHRLCRILVFSRFLKHGVSGLCLPRQCHRTYFWDRSLKGGSSTSSGRVIVTDGLHIYCRLWTTEGEGDLFLTFQSFLFDRGEGLNPWSGKFSTQTWMGIVFCAYEFRGLSIDANLGNKSLNLVDFNLFLVTKSHISN